MQDLIALIYGALMLWAVIGFVWSICGMLNDSNNTYPIPMLASAIASGALSQLLLPA